LIHDVGKVVFDKHILANKDQIDRYTTEEQKRILMLNATSLDLTTRKSLPIFAKNGKFPKR
jgi:hypothetical protein